MLGAVELASRRDQPGACGAEVAERCFEAGVLVRATGDTLVLLPPLILATDDIDQIAGTIAAAIRATAFRR